MPKKVFVIEDDPSHEMLLCRLIRLVAPEAEIHCAESAEEAFLALDIDSGIGLSYDLIIADVFLAGKATGLDLMQTCREYYPNIPILITSSMPLLQFFDAIGPNSIAPTYLPKPINPGECQQILESMLAAG